MGDKKKVMIIDDEKDFLMIAKLNLEETGNYEVLTMVGAKGVISALHSFGPDLILLDMMMPDMGGLEACEILNKDSTGKTTPIIILSALDKDADRLKAYKLGVVDYITKPIDRNTLIAKIEKALKFK